MRAQERPIRNLDGVRIINIREGGIVEAYVHISRINQEEVPVDAKHVSDLARSIDKESQKGSHTGQLTPVLLAEVPGLSKLPIVDGFHRVPAVASLGHHEVFATIKPNSTWEEVLDLRILTASMHKSVRFSRLVDWAEQSWEKSPWADEMDILTAFNLRFMSPKAAARTEMSEEETDKVKKWVDAKCELWNMSASQVHRYLQTAKSADPELVKEARERKSGHKLDAVTPNHLAAIIKFIPNKYDLQRIVAEAATEHALTVAQTRTVAVSVAMAKSPDEAREIVKSGSWRAFEGVYKPVAKKRAKRLDSKDKEPEPSRKDYDNTLLDRFFEDQVTIAQLMVENAILIGRYVPETNGATKDIVAKPAVASVDELEDEVLGIEKGTQHEWDPEKVAELFKTVNKLTPHLIRFLRTRRPLIGEHDAEDAVATAIERFTVRIYDGRLPEEYEDEEKLKRLLAKMVTYAGTDHIRKERGRLGQKPFQVSYSQDAEEGKRSMIETELALSHEEVGYEIAIDKNNLDFVKNLLPSLKERERRVLILKGYFGLTHYEIARVIGTTEGTINVEFNSVKRKAEKFARENKSQPQPTEEVSLQN